MTPSGFSPSTMSPGRGYHVKAPNRCPGSSERRLPTVPGGARTHPGWEVDCSPSSVSGCSPPPLWVGGLTGYGHYWGCPPLPPLVSVGSLLPSKPSPVGTEPPELWGCSLCVGRGVSLKASPPPRFPSGASEGAAGQVAEGTGARVTLDAGEPGHPPHPARPGFATAAAPRWEEDFGGAGGVGGGGCAELGDPRVRTALSRRMGLKASETRVKQPRRGGYAPLR